MKQKLYIDVVNVRKSIKTGDKRMRMCMSFLTVEKFVVQKTGPCEGTFRRVQYYFCVESTTFALTIITRDLMYSYFSLYTIPYFLLF